MTRDGSVFFSFFSFRFCFGIKGGEEGTQLHTHKCFIGKKFLTFQFKSLSAINRSKLCGFHGLKELIVVQIKEEMKRR